MEDKLRSLRVFSDDWLNPLPIDTLFDKVQPLEIDLGCGKGRFLLARAARFPEVNFFGIDRMLRRIRKVDRKALRQGLTNIRLMRMEGYYAVSYLIPAGSVQTYYIFFPDPWPKKRHHDHRLFNAQFMDALFRTMKSDGCVHFATDHIPYYEEVKALVLKDSRFREIGAFEPMEEERTDFERYYIEKTPIGRFSFQKRERSS